PVRQCIDDRVDAGTRCVAVGDAVQNYVVSATSPRAVGIFGRRAATAQGKTTAQFTGRAR
ncbi:MAG TPA: hypothetical protein VE714_11970, partial [Gemmatimonadales bacterium]|nr:hypothetical protein [Gemmatimonadales bacterium]